MKKDKTRQCDVVFGIDIETDIGSFTTNYEGVKYGRLCCQ